MRLSRICFVLNPMTDVLIRRGEDTHTHTDKQRRMTREDRSTG